MSQRETIHNFSQKLCNHVTGFYVDQFKTVLRKPLTKLLISYLNVLAFRELYWIFSEVDCGGVVDVQDNTINN